MFAHTYTVHVTFTANDDAHALRIAETLNKELGSGLEVVPSRLERYAVTAMHLTDADDYAEVIEPDLLCRCGAPAEDRLRIGSGQRVCRQCADKALHGVYAIRDTDI
jgi:uncharacterized protein YuzB (UPF0349 family)